ncbi:MAG TPA: hypothetical protein QGH28_06220 [Chloroflexota bacterium]|jgi:hypothetical protein|nr:hypothetical protein [Chloroflexota bacterium]
MVIAREIMDHPNVIEISRARPIIDATAGQALSSPDTLLELIRSSGADDSLQTNMVNSGICVLALCGPLGITDPNEMEVMALAGFLHDIGKTQIPRDVLYKQGPFSKSEWTLMRQHVLLGTISCARFATCRTRSCRPLAAVTNAWMARAIRRTGHPLHRPGYRGR